MKIAIAALTFVVAMAATACNTIDGLGQTVNGVGKDVGVAASAVGGAISGVVGGGSSEEVK